MNPQPFFMGWSGNDGTCQFFVELANRGIRGDPFLRGAEGVQDGRVVTPADHAAECLEAMIGQSPSQEKCEASGHGSFPVSALPGEVPGA